MRRNAIVVVVVEFPTRELGQNHRGSWRTTFAAKRDARFQAKIEAQNVLSRSTFRFSTSSTFRVQCAIYAPNRRTDVMNNFCALKNAIDGIADALCVNDSRFVDFRFSRAGIDSNNPRVEITVSSLQSSSKC
jgi:Holliday junction resolvase RusA-like endonuclease